MAFGEIILEQTLDREPTQYPGLDAFPETSIGLGVVTHLIVPLARYPYEAIFDPPDSIIFVVLSRRLLDIGPRSYVASTDEHSRSR